MIVLDTTILAHAVGVDHPLRIPSLRALEAIADGRIEGTTTVEVIQEFAHVRARREGRADAAKAAQGYAELLSPLLIVGEETVETGLRIFEAHDTLGAFDAFLAASALSSGAEALVSADKSFSVVPRLNHVVPGTDAFEQLIGG